MLCVFCDSVLHTSQQWSQVLQQLNLPRSRDEPESGERASACIHPVAIVLPSCQQLYRNRSTTECGEVAQARDFRQTRESELVQYGNHVSPSVRCYTDVTT